MLSITTFLLLLCCMTTCSVINLGKGWSLGSRSSSGVCISSSNSAKFNIKNSFFSNLKDGG